MAERAFRLRHGGDVEAVSITVLDGRTKTLKPDDDGIVTVSENDQAVISELTADYRWREVPVPEQKPAKTKGVKPEPAAATKGGE